MRRNEDECKRRGRELRRLDARNSELSARLARAGDVEARLQEAERERDRAQAALAAAQSTSRGLSVRRGRSGQAVGDTIRDAFLIERAQRQLDRAEATVARLRSQRGAVGAIQDELAVVREDQRRLEQELSLLDCSDVPV